MTADLRAVSVAMAERHRAFAALDATDYADETKAILRAIIATGHQREFFSANHVRPLLPDDVHRPRIGRAFALAQELGLIRFVAFEKSTDKGTHGKPVGVYRST